jgi:hypothetical protein
MIKRPQCGNVGSKRNESLLMQMLCSFFGNQEWLGARHYVDSGTKKRKSDTKIIVRELDQKLELASPRL